MYYPYSENKGADQLRGYREADLRLCFRICKRLVFSRRGLNAFDRKGQSKTVHKRSFFFRSVDNKRMSDFFKNDFNEDRWRKAALKNAFDLLGRQRFEHAAAFFLLADHLQDAIEVRVLFSWLNRGCSIFLFQG